MRKIVILVSLMMLLAVGSIYLTVTSKVMGWDPKDGSKTYENREWGFSISYPQSWITSSDKIWVDDVKSSYDIFKAVASDSVIDTDLKVIYGSTGVSVGVIPLGVDSLTLHTELMKNGLTNFTLTDQMNVVVNGTEGRIDICTFSNNSSVLETNDKGKVYEGYVFVTDYPVEEKTVCICVFFLSSKYDEKFAADIINTYQKLKDVATEN